jgi:hypothetical protein
MSSIYDICPLPGLITTPPAPGQPRYSSQTPGLRVQGLCTAVPAARVAFPEPCSPVPVLLEGWQPLPCVTHGPLTALLFSALVTSLISNTDGNKFQSTCFCKFKFAWHTVGHMAQLRCVCAAFALRHQMKPSQCRSYVHTSESILCLLPTLHLKGL